MGKNKTIMQESGIESALDGAMSEIQSLRDEMAEWRDNIEEKFSQTDKFERVSEAHDALDLVADNTPDVPEALADVRVAYREEFGRNMSRRVRLGNAVAMLEAVIATAEERASELEMQHDECERELEQAQEERDRKLDAVDKVTAERGSFGSDMEYEVALQAAQAELDEAEALVADKESDLEDYSEDKCDEIRTFIDEVQEVVDNVQDVDFPGMFG